MNQGDRSFIALGNRLAGIPEVRTLGVKPDFHDYSAAEQDLIRRAPLVLYPTLNYAQILSTAGKRIFPSLETDLYADDKIKQTTLFSLVSVPHPRTRFYDSRRFDAITSDFTFPFIAKKPRASARGRGVFLITGQEELEAYLQDTRTAYIQEYIHHSRHLRVVLICCRHVLSYWLTRGDHPFKTNLHQGGTLDFSGVPQEAVTLAEAVTRRCRFTDVGLDLVQGPEGRWLVLEANMKFGREGFKAAGMDLKEIYRERLLSGEIMACCPPQDAR